MRNLKEKGKCLFCEKKKKSFNNPHRLKLFVYALVAQYCTETKYPTYWYEVRKVLFSYGHVS